MELTDKERAELKKELGELRTKFYTHVERLEVLEEDIIKIERIIFGDSDLGVSSIRSQLREEKAAREVLELSLSRARWFIAGLAAANVAQVSGLVALLSNLFGAV